MRWRIDTARPVGWASVAVRRAASLLAAGRWLLLLAAVSSAGCASYQFGARSMFRDDIRTVYVPVARNETFRHDLGPRLTEAVIRHIELQTPYKVTGDPGADSTLQLRITHQLKKVLTESASDDPRALDAVISIHAHWTDRNGTPMMRNQLALDDQPGVMLAQGSHFVPEAGQSVQTGLQETLERLADRIVSQMELRW